MQRSDLEPLSEMLGPACIGLVAINGFGDVEYVSSTCRSLLRRDTDRMRLEAALRSAGVVGPSGVTAGPFHLEFQSGRNRYGVSGKRMGGDLCLLIWACPEPVAPPASMVLPANVLLAQRFRLTRRECDVAHLLARGLRNIAISAKLVISPYTARRHTERVLMKLGVRSRAEVGPVLLGLTDTGGERAG